MKSTLETENKQCFRIQLLRKIKFLFKKILNKYLMGSMKTANRSFNVTLFIKTDKKQRSNTSASTH